MTKNMRMMNEMKKTVTMNIMRVTHAGQVARSSAVCLVST